MLQLRVICEPQDTDAVIDVLRAEPGVAHLTLSPGVCQQPHGDLIEAAIARESAEATMDRLVEQGVPRRGQISLHPVDILLSDTAAAAELAAPGTGTDAVIWDELVATTGEESQLNPTFLAFLTIACLLAAVGVINNSAIALVGAMVVSPDFGPLAGLAVAAVGRRHDIAVRAAVALGAGFGFAMVVTAVLALLARVSGIYHPATLSQLSDVSFIAQIGPYSVIVALLAGAAGMLALTSGRSGVLIGVFISVTTVPAAGFAALAAVGGQWQLCAEALGQLLINFVGVTVAGAITLRIRRQQVVGQQDSPRPGRR